MRHDLDVDDLVRRYLNGEGVNPIATGLGVQSATVRRRLVAAGVPVRDRSQAMHLRMARMPVEERRRLSAAANAARRTRTITSAPRDPAEEIYTRGRARTRSRTLSQASGQGETELRDLLVGRGVRLGPQLAIGRYNVDLAVPPVAVEVWWGAGYPIRHANHAQRVVYLADFGWWSLYVWLSRRLPDETTADAVVALVEAARRYPLAVRPKYGVVRGDGEMTATGEAKIDEVAVVPPAVGVPQAW